MAYNKKYFELALRMADRARGQSNPNPGVGAILVKNNAIIGRGATRACGSDHAEIVALKQAGVNAAGAELYVTLEPCAHWGRTPPCADAIIKAGIKSVYAGPVDPNPKVNGAGFARLREAGIDVTTGLYQDRVREQLAGYYCWRATGRPLVTVKQALTLDGCIADSAGRSQWITGEKARLYGHRLRYYHDVVMVGSGTALADDPLLTVRLPHCTRQPLRVVVDTRLRLPETSRLAASALQNPVWVFTAVTEGPRLEALQKTGVRVITVPKKESGLDLAVLLNILGKESFTSVLVEGGGLVSALIKAQLANRLALFYGPLLLGAGKQGLTGLGVNSLTKAVSVKNCKIRRFDNDIFYSGDLEYHTSNQGGNNAVPQNG